MFSVEDGRVSVFLLLPLIPVILGCVRDDERDTQGEKQKKPESQTRAPAGFYARLNEADIFFPSGGGRDQTQS